MEISQPPIYTAISQANTLKKKKSKPYIAAREYVTDILWAIQNICALFTEVISVIMLLFTFREMSDHFFTQDLWQGAVYCITKPL